MQNYPYLLKKFLKEHHYSDIWIAYSGGLDSTVLLHLVAGYIRLKPQDNITIKAIHINHNLSSNALQWENHSKKICTKLDIPLVIKKVASKPNKGESIESWARTQRYNFFSELGSDIKKCGVMLAHHQNDQAETFLLNALKGSSPSGLRAMPNKRKLSNNVDIIRPLLNLSQNHLIEYATKHELTWIEDESNLNDKFDRNYLRRQVIDKIQVRWPNSATSLSRSANLCAENHTTLMEYIDNEIEKLSTNITEPNAINYSNLIQHDFIKRKLIIKRWLEKTQSHIPSFNTLKQFCEQLSSAPSGWEYRLNHNLTVRRYQENLSIHYCTQRTEAIFCYVWTKNTEQIYIPELNKKITNEDLINFNIDPKILKSENLYLRSRQPKDTCKPIGRYKKNKLKIIFQEKNISSWERKSAVILSLTENHQEKIIGVWPFFMCE